jgi:hypothetical protein
MFSERYSVSLKSYYSVFSPSVPLFSEVNNTLLSSIQLTQCPSGKSSRSPRHGQNAKILQKIKKNQGFAPGGCR